jgi:hypothetical protein
MGRNDKDSFRGEEYADTELPIRLLSCCAASAHRVLRGGDKNELGIIISCRSASSCMFAAMA